MTSFGFTLGLIPLMFASSAGATGNRVIGMDAIGVMFIGTLLGVFVIPVLCCAGVLLSMLYSYSKYPMRYIPTRQLLIRK